MGEKWGPCMDVESPMAIGHGVDSILRSACQLLARQGDVGSPTTPIQNDRTLHACLLPVRYHIFLNPFNRWSGLPFYCFVARYEADLFSRQLI